MSGMIVGSFFAGWVVDRIGRRPGLVIFVAIAACGSLANAFAQDYILFCSIRGRFHLRLEGAFSKGLHDMAWKIFR
jgi:MFS family permease